MVIRISELFRVLVLVLCGCIPASAQLTTGYDFEVVAGDDTDGDAIWEDAVGTNDVYFLLDSSPAVTRSAVSSVTRLTHAYNFPGGSLLNEAGGELVSAGTTNSTSFEDGTPTDWTTGNVSIELWIRPHDLTPTPTNGQIVFEHGGTTGLGLFIITNALVLVQDTQQVKIAYNLSTDPSGLLLGSATTEFLHVVITRNASTFATEMYINAVSVGTGSDDDSDWSGSDGMGLGTMGGANAGGRGAGQNATESFDGEIAVYRMYQQVLTATEVTNHFSYITNTSVTAGYDFEVDAGADSDGDEFWEDTVGTSGLDLNIDTNVASIVTRNALTTGTLLTHAYDFPGGTNGNVGGAELVTTNPTTAASFDDAGTDWSVEDLSMEIWFRPDAITSSVPNGQILFEDGGGTGLGLFISSNELVLSQDSDEAQISYNLLTDPSHVLLGAATSEFIQVVIVRSASSPFETEMYINATSVGTSLDDNDWSGGDAAAFGTLGGANTGGTGRRAVQHGILRRGDCAHSSL